MATRRKPEQYDFRRQLFDELILPISGSGRRSTVRTHKVEYITIHHMTILSTNNGGALLTCFRVWKSRKASAHYGVDKKYVAQFVYDNRAAWGNGNALSNQKTIVVEHANKNGEPKWEIDEVTLETSALLVAGLHITHKLGRPTTIGFGLGGTIRAHQTFTRTACPGPYFRKHWARYVKMCQEAYDNMVNTTPKPKPKPKPEEKDRVLVSGVHWNVAGSDTVNGYQDANSYRGDDVARHAQSLGFNVFLTCEAGQSNLLAGMNKVLGKMDRWATKAKAIWADPKKVAALRGVGIYSSGIFSYRNTQKWGVAYFGKRQEKKFSFLEVHLDYQKPAKQAKQLKTIFKKWKKHCDQLGIPVKNRVVVGDFNWDGSKGDDPFKALGDYDFIEHGDKTAATFLDGRHLDGVLAHKDCEIAVGVKPREDKNMKLSDHFPIRFVIELV